MVHGKILWELFTGRFILPILVVAAFFYPDCLHRSYAQDSLNEALHSTYIVVPGKRTAPPKDAIDRYSPQNIDNMAAMTIGEVIDRLERRNGGQSFSIIVNGRRLANIDDLREIPPEALAGIEILPGSSAGRYGFNPQNKVLNLVLKRKFSSRTISPDLRLPTEGGGESGDGAFRYVTIRGEKRFNGAASGQITKALEGEERRHLFDDGTDDDALTPYRTLVPFSRRLTLTPGLAFPVGALSMNGSGSFTDNLSRQLNRFFTSDSLTNKNIPGGGDHATVTHGIIDQSHTRSYRLGLTAFGVHGRLNWSAELTGAFSSSETGSHISHRVRALLLPNGVLAGLPSAYTPLSVSIRNTDLGGALTAHTPLFSLPAGDVSANARLGTDIQQLASIYGFGQGSHESSAQRQSRVHFGITAPLTGPAFPVAWLPGVTGLSLNGDYEQAQRMGSLANYDLSWQWQPVDRLSLSLGRNRTGSLTSLGARNAPVIRTPGTLVVDATTGNYALVTQISGGTPNLRSSSRINDTARVSYDKTLGATNVATTLEYTSSRIINPVISTVTPTPQFQQLFPDRFTRNADGLLTAMDTRSFNASGEITKILRPNLHLSGMFLPHDGNPGDDLSWDVSLSDEWTLHDALRPSREGTEVDLLKTPIDGLRGAARHKLEGEIETSWRRWNFQFSASWRSGSHVQDLTASTPYSVHYAGFWTADTVISYTFRLQKKPLRLWLSISNLFDRRQSIRDSEGHTPEAYQPVFLDPTGRVIAIRASIPL